MAATFQEILYSATATGNGTWFDASQFDPNFSITFAGFVGANTLQVRVSNKAERPLDSDDESQYGADVAANGVREITATFRWIKVKKTAGTDAVIATLFAQLRHG